MIKENLNNIITNIKKFYYKINQDSISEYAAECAFFTILSFFPALIFLVSILKYIYIDEKVLLIVIKDFIPKMTNDLIIQILEEINQKSFKITFFSAIATLWSSGKGFFSLNKFFKKIYKDSNIYNNFFIRLEGVIYTFLFIILFIISLNLFVFGSFFEKIIEKNFYSINILVMFLLKIKFIIIILILFLIFMILYRFFYKKKIKLKYQAIGAIVASIGWYICSIFFSFYAEVFGNFNNIYGSLSNIILIMIWIYTSIYIILIGAELNSIFFQKS